MKVYRLEYIINNATREHVKVDWLKTKRFDIVHKNIFDTLLKKKYPNHKVKWLSSFIDKDTNKVIDDYFREV